MIRRSLIRGTCRYIWKTKTKTKQAEDQRIDKNKDKDEDEDKVQSVIRWATRRDSPEPDKRHLSIHMVIFG